MLLLQVQYVSLISSINLSNLILAGHPGQADGALRLPGRLPEEGERAGADHRRPDAEVRAVLRAAADLPGPGSVLQGRHLLPVRDLPAQVTPPAL